MSFINKKLGEYVGGRMIESFVSTEEVNQSVLSSESFIEQRAVAMVRKLIKNQHFKKGQIKILIAIAHYEEVEE